MTPQDENNLQQLWHTLIQQHDLDSVVCVSSALKRAASVWGIGRYLYKLPVGWAECSDDKKKYQKGIKVSADEMNHLSIERHETLPKWNYTLSPQ